MYTGGCSPFICSYFSDVSRVQDRGRGVWYLRRNSSVGVKDVRHARSFPRSVAFAIATIVRGEVAGSGRPVSRCNGAGTIGGSSGNISVRVSISVENDEALGERGSARWALCEAWPFPFRSVARSDVTRCSGSCFLRVHTCTEALAAVLGERRGSRAPARWDRAIRRVSKIEI